MATRRQREAAAPRPAANAAVEGASFSTISSARLNEEFQRQISKFYEIWNVHEAQVQKLIEELESEKAQEEAQVQKLMEELESEKAQKEAQVQKVVELESEKAQKEAQVQKLMAENVKLGSMLDKKEAQLQAMSEQCKFMALNHHN